MSVADDDKISALLPGLRLLALRALGDESAAEEIAQEAITRVLPRAKAGSCVTPRRSAASRSRWRVT
jgi:DNA-directed RNA polymerase specialized sigma24 family protein